MVNLSYIYKKEDINLRQNERILMKTICVFCSSSDGVDEAYHQTATDLGNRIGKLRLDLIYGGASIGLMGAVARGVHDKGGRVVGVIPEFFRKKDETIEYADADELIVTEDMRSRKAIMDRRADAFIVLPGGIGTLEEAMEIMSMKQLGLTDKPLVFINMISIASSSVPIPPGSTIKASARLSIIALRLRISSVTINSSASAYSIVSSFFRKNSGMTPTTLPPLSWTPRATAPIKPILAPP
jgi:uncharacterized protein (TIGR00730 family)